MSIFKGGAMTALTAVLVRASNQIVLVVVTLIAARFLTPTDFGVYAIAAALTTLVRNLLYSGAFEYLLKAKDLKQASTACLIVNFVLSLGLCIVLGLFAMVSHLFFGSERVGLFIWALIPSNFVAAYSAWQEAQLLRDKKISRYYIATAIAEVLAAVGVLSMLAAGLGLVALVAQIYFRFGALIIFYRLVQRPARLTRPDWSEVKAVWAWSLARYGAVSVTFVSTYGADIILGAVLSPAATGLYRASSRIVTAAADMFAQPIRMLSLTAFSDRASRGLGTGDLWPRMMAAMAFVAWAALAGLALVADKVAPLVLGPQWHGAGPIITILCCVRMFGLMDSVTTPLLVAASRQHAVFWAQAVSACVVLAVTAYFGRHGVQSATLASGAVVIGLSGTLLVLARHVSPPDRKLIPEVLTTAFYPVALMLACAGATRMMLERGHFGEPRLHLPLIVAAGVVAWGVAVFSIRKRAARTLKSLAPEQGPELEAAVG